MRRETIQTKPSKAGAFSKLIIGLLLTLTVVGLGLAYYFYQKTEELQQRSTENNQLSEEARAKQIKSKVAKLISVPKDEIPTIASVTDTGKLNDQPFFKDAQNGDIIVIFPAAKKAIIYRESDNRLVNVGPIAITDSGAESNNAASGN